MKIEDSADKQLPFNLLAVGPLPPPFTGTTVSFQVFCEAVTKTLKPIQLTTIDSSPKAIKKNRSIASTQNFKKAGSIIFDYARRISQNDKVIIFGSNGFQISLIPLLILIARIFSRPVYIRPFGGSLDQFLQNIPTPIRKLYFFMLRRSSGIIVETELLYNYFESKLKGKTIYIPGYRHLPKEIISSTRLSQTTRFIFVGHVREEKGIFTLLEAFGESKDDVQCDIFGPIYPEIEETFLIQAKMTPNVTYKGILDSKNVVQTMSDYDVFVFPTVYQGEGHPGVVIEAMIAGLPIITTQHRSIPEIVEDQINGLLIEPNNATALREAVSEISQDAKVRSRMSAANQEKKDMFDAAEAVQRIIKFLSL